MVSVRALRTSAGASRGQDATCVSGVRGAVDALFQCTQAALLPERPLQEWRDASGRPQDGVFCAGASSCGTRSSAGAREHVVLGANVSAQAGERYLGGSVELHS